MCAPIDQPPATLADAIGRAHCWSEDAYRPAAPCWPVCGGSRRISPPLTGSCTPSPSRRSPTAALSSREQRRRAGEIVRLLWTLDHTVSGDARLHGPVSGVVRRLAALVREHAEAEDALVAGLEATLPDAMLTLLHRRYADTVRRAPTRPHPVTAGVYRRAAAAGSSGVPHRGRGRPCPRRRRRPWRPASAGRLITVCSVLMPGLSYCESIAISQSVCLG